MESSRSEHHHQQDKQTTGFTRTSLMNSSSNNPDPNPNTDSDPIPVARYRECLKNHAASSGGHVLDGCGEFMPASSDALSCAACECHRSFHRRETQTCRNTNYDRADSAEARRNPSHNRSSLPLRRYSQPVMMAFGGAESSSDHDIAVRSSAANKSKRFRTKFRPEQKEKMTEFAHRLGWRIQKHDEHEVQRFCAEVGVKRQVFKVWMHNNKQIKKREADESKPNNITREIN